MADSECAVGWPIGEPWLLAVVTATRGYGVDTSITAMVEAPLRKVGRWAEREDGLEAVALVGSRARGEARPASDVDLVVLSTRAERLIANRGWLARFGAVARVELEDWGRVTSLRTWYQSGLEVEFSIATPDWAIEPDEGTRRVASEGITVLWDRSGILATLGELWRAP